MNSSALYGKLSIVSRRRALVSGINLLTYESAGTAYVASTENATAKLSFNISRHPRASEDDVSKVNKIIPDSSAPAREAGFANGGNDGFSDASGIQRCHFSRALNTVVRAAAGTQFLRDAASSGSRGGCA
jgi:hypothetical protein